MRDTNGMVDIVCELSALSDDFDHNGQREELRQLARCWRQTHLDRRRAARQMALAREINRFMRGMRGVQLPGHTILLCVLGLWKASA